MKNTFTISNLRNAEVFKVVLFSLLFTINFSAITVTAQHTLTIDDVSFDASTGTIKDYLASYTDIVIPESFNINGEDVEVTKIGVYAFNRNSLTSVSISNSIKLIEDWAFNNNSLTNLTIPNSVITIGKSAFNSNSLTVVSFVQNSNIRLIQVNAFQDNPGLSGIVLPANINSGFTGYKDEVGNIYAAGDNITDFSISYYAVLPVHTLTLNDIDFIDGVIATYWAGYTDIIIPESFNVNGEDVTVTCIGEEAFRSKSLTSVIIPNSVTTIEHGAFLANLLTSITIPNGVTTIEYETFCSNLLKSVVIPNSVTAIEEWGFSENALTGLEIPESVTSIGFEAFESNSLTSVAIPGSVTFIGDAAFNNNSITEINGKESNGIIYARNSDGTDNKSIIVSYGGVETEINFIPETVTAITSRAFFHNSLTGVIIPPNVAFIAWEAFRHNSLTNVTFEQNSCIRLIQRSAFADNTDLTGITLPSNVNTGFAGYKDEADNDYAVGDNITDFSTVYYAKLPVHTLTLDDIEFKDGKIINYWGGYIDINIPSSFKVNEMDESVISIGEEAFVSSSLTSVTLPSTLITIGNYVFEENNLTAITLPNPVIKEGYTFTEWYDEDGSIVTEITDFYTSYQAQFSFTGVMVSGRITTGDEQGLAIEGLKSISIDDPESVTLYISGDTSGTRPVNDDGTYSFALNAGRSIMITPVKEGYSFSPESISLNNVQGDVENLDFASVATDINEQNALSFKIYPNPFTTQTTIEFDNLDSSPYFLLVYSITGAKVFEMKDIKTNKIILERGALNKGTYIISLTGKKEFKNRIVIVK